MWSLDFKKRISINKQGLVFYDNRKWGMILICAEIALQNIEV